MSNKHCRFLSNGSKINVQEDKLLWRPCCFYSRSVDITDRTAYLKELEYTSSATGWLPECSSCKKIEDSGVVEMSPRLAGFDRIPEEFETGECVDLEISFDSKCNAACLSCNAYSSTTWDKFNRKHKITIEPIKIYKDDHFQKLVDLVPMDKLRTVFIAGGEPFYSDTHLKILKHILQVHPDPKKIMVIYVTNGTIVPDDDTVELWNAFKDVFVVFSTDGVKERFEYLRWPLTWDRFERTVFETVKLKQRQPNIKIMFNTTINPLNVIYWQEIEDWITNNIPKEVLAWPNSLIRPTLCVGNMDFTQTPLAVRDLFYKQYGHEHKVSKLLATSEFNPDCTAMFKYLDTMDALRNNSWRKTFPEIVGYFKC